jgi:integrase
MLLGITAQTREISAALCDPTRREALLTALAPGSLVDVQKVLTEYEVHSKAFKRPKTIDNDGRRLKAFFDHVSVHYINDVTTKAVNEYFASRVDRDHLSPATVLRYREILHALYEFARQQGYVKANPIDGVPRPRIPDRDIRFLTLEQIEGALEAVADTSLEAVVATAIYAGMRREEICWLTTKDVDLTEDRALIRVRSKTVDGDSWMPNTKKNRTILISSD